METELVRLMAKRRAEVESNGAIVQPAFLCQKIPSTLLSTSAGAGASPSAGDTPPELSQSKR